MDRLTSMAIFAKAAEAGSFAAASAALGMSSQLVGKHVRALEARYGMQLINRTTRRQSLTEAGRAFYEGCKSVLAEAEAIEALTANLQAAARGTLRVNAPVSFGAYRLAPALVRYLSDHPEVQVELTLSDRVVDLVDEGYDAVIRIAPLPDSRLIARPLAPYRLIACASPEYLALRGTPRRPEDLADHECLGFAYWGRPPEPEWELTSGQASARVRVGGRLSINNGQGLRMAALAGLGVILQPLELIEEDLASGRLLRVLPDYEAPPLPIHILFSPARRPTPKLRSFIDFVTTTFA